eukprot:12643833-Alexandrium_andersonii.AAC.1
MSMETALDRSPERAASSKARERSHEAEAADLPPWTPNISGSFQPSTQGRRARKRTAPHLR